MNNTSWFVTALRRSRQALVACVLSVGTFQSALAAAPIEIATIPPSLGGGVAPNILFIIDDSGSMQFELPENQYDLGLSYLYPPVSNMYGDGIYTSNIFDFSDDNPLNRYFRSQSNNPFYYNPAKTYEPWYKGDRSQWPAANPKAAPRFPGRADSGTVDLTSLQSWNRWVIYNNNNYYYNDDNRNFWPVTFYALKPNATDPLAKSSYFRYQIRNGTGYRKNLGNGNEVTLTDFSWGDGVTRTAAEELQNYANWYSYYRSRTMAARAGIGNAFSQQSEGMRVGYGRLNKGSSDIDGVSTDVIVNGVRLFKGSDREQFFNRLYTDRVPNAGTPLRNALKRAGQYFERSDNRGPWGAEPGINNSADQLECRQSFTILMTDGYWSGDSPGVGNADGNDGDAIGDYAGYKAEAPFSDDVSNTLADVAMYYWKRDLRTNLANKVPTSPADPAFWQHMVTFGVGLGVAGTINYPNVDPFAQIGKDNPSFDWPNPNNSEAAKVDDLLHAGVNSRGGFFSAADPDTFAAQLSNVLSAIVSRVENSATAAAASSTVFRQGALSYSAGYRSTDWSGAIQASEILKGGARGKLIWDAERELESLGTANRKLFTSTASGGVALDSLNSLSDAQKTALNTGLDGNADGLGAKRISWLRGNAEDAEFRSRAFTAEGSTVSRDRLIGDIIGSNPQYAGKTNFGYRRLPGDEGSSYVTYRTSDTYNDRPDVIYVGANDGFLHGFDSLTGKELFAYMPSEYLAPATGKSYAQINQLMDRQYDHRFFVDGTPTISDAYINGEWRTILVGTTGVGGRTVFALDVTDPESFTADDVLWEFTDPDLGQGVQQAQIVRLASGDWAAVFGNGYNTSSNESALFVVNLEDGSLIAKLATGEGDATNPNGLAAPVVMVNPQNGTASRVYAGDLLGNLWRFNLSSTPYKATQVFEATDEDGNPQPITAAPNIAFVPEGSSDEVIVVFGTGSFFRVADAGNNQEQSLYGIYDDGSAKSLGRTDLLDQQITEQAAQDYSVNAGTTSEVQTLDIRAVSDDTLGNNDEGWVLDLDTSAGERVISPPAFPSGYPVKRVRFSTLIPETNACGSGSEGYIMDVNLTTGGGTANAVFDLNRDGRYDVQDSAGSNVVNGIRNVVSGERISVILDRGSDLFLDSEIVDVPPDYDGPEDVTDDGSNGEGGGGDSGGGGEPPCTGLLCGDAEKIRFGRQNWEELR